MPLAYPYYPRHRVDTDDSSHSFGGYFRPTPGKAGLDSEGIDSLLSYAGGGSQVHSYVIWSAISSVC